MLLPQCSHCSEFAFCRKFQQAISCPRNCVGLRGFTVTLPPKKRSQALAGGKAVRAQGVVGSETRAMPVGTFIWLTGGFHFFQICCHVGWDTSYLSPEWGTEDMDEFSPSPSGAHCLSAEFTTGSNKLSCRKVQVNMYIYIYIFMGKRAEELQMDITGGIALKNWKETGSGKHAK